uniref:Uncharacterized protein n=1 Tax=Nitrosospira lacus TaxID=1288494 RepID=A0A1W6SSX8_9PROT
MTGRHAISSKLILNLVSPAGIGQREHWRNARMKFVNQDIHSLTSKRLFSWKHWEQVLQEGRFYGK